MSGAFFDDGADSISDPEDAEVIGDAGIYFDPLSVEEFAAGLKEIADPKRLADLAPKALAQAAQFDAPRMAAPS